MTRVDIHPEELVDLELENELDGTDAERLAAHREECATCALEKQLMADFGAELAEEDEADAEVLQLVLGRLEGEGRRAPTRGWAATRWMRVAAVAAAVLLAATAGVAMVSKGTFWIISSTPPTAPEPEPEPEPARQEGRALRPAAQAPTPEVPAPTGDPAPEEPGLPEPLPPARTPQPLRAPTPELADSTPAPAEPDRGPSAAELFARANSARRAGNFPEAVQGYRELGRLYPGSREEVTSRVSLGRVLLNRMGNPSRALRLFDSYLATAPRGTLAQEARVGRALSLGRLGRRDAERGAWQDLIDNHPGSIHAERAGRRLEILGADEVGGDE